MNENNTTSPGDKRAALPPATCSARIKKKHWKREIWSACRSVRPWIEIAWELEGRGIPHAVILKEANAFGLSKTKPNKELSHASEEVDNG